MIAEGVTNSGLIDRLTYATLSKISRPEMVVFAAIVFTGIMSALVNNLVAFAMALPVFRRVISLTHGEKSGNGNFGKSLVLGGSYGSLAGGLATTIGTGPNLIAAAYAKVSFAAWSSFGIPLAIILMIVIWKALTLIFRVSPGEFSFDKSLMQSRLEELGPLKRPEKLALGTLAITVGLLITAPLTSVDSYAVTLFGAVLFFLTGTLTWRHAEKNVDWGTIVFFSSALSVGNVLIATGTANWVIASIMAGVGASVSSTTITLLLMVIGVSLTQVVSNVGLDGHIAAYRHHARRQHEPAH